jgi:hypothetical protein
LGLRGNEHSKWSNPASSNRGGVVEISPPLKIYRGIYCERAYVGGNWNNDLNCGPFYANLYNEPSNTNTNIGAALSYSLRNNPL